MFLWTDDMARLVAGCGVAIDGPLAVELERWRSKPWAFRADEDATPLATALRLLGLASAAAELDGTPPSRACGCQAVGDR